MERWCPRSIWDVVGEVLEQDEAFSIFKQQFDEATTPSELDKAVVIETEIEERLVDQGFVEEDETRLAR